MGSKQEEKLNFLHFLYQPGNLTMLLSSHTGPGASSQLGTTSGGNPFQPQELVLAEKNVGTLYLAFSIPRLPCL